MGSRASTGAIIIYHARAVVGARAGSYSLRFAVKAIPNAGQSVTKPGTDFMPAYRKRPDRPNLLLAQSWESRPSGYNLLSANWHP
jgi:hypothetical protein